MSTDLEDPKNPPTVTLLRGILGDLNQLLQQQFALTRREVVLELKNCGRAGVFAGLAAAMFLVSGSVFCVSLAHLLHLAVSPTSPDPATIPLWMCHAISAAAFAAVGGILVFMAREKCTSASVSHDPTAETFQKETS